ncbi:MAG: DNA-methyltransferase [Candidatus Hodarchaeota archaeon]
MNELANNSIDLIVTSPPYGVGLEYEEHLRTIQDYMKLITSVLRECKRVLKPDGRICWNVAFTATFKGEKTKNYPDALFSPFKQSIYAFDEVGLPIRDFITWYKMASDKGKSCWGSWRSATAPYLKHDAEMIIVGFKEIWKKQREWKGPSMTKDEFMQYCRDFWKFRPETQDTQHPAPFPVQLPMRCIKLYSLPGDIILDPFLGSGTTLLAARMIDNRIAIGYEINDDYKEIIYEKTKLNLPDLLKKYFPTPLTLLDYLKQEPVVIK